ncbi:sodium:proton antiporter [Nesterenkonia lacusekhoensis]|uniref:Multisubunit Na+/H+ antiporter MnhC subunit n=1 Tax=Nesterenkonia lacusekhoensis TaxID=150832 RepID=A0ABS4T5S5_9MICC|nr:cation:proton antiporter subunit C [Nesterenkonia lacusekhoensis]MBP2318611.1 multisubunit Na+/H+ antiporter MnhC subunit [Nesterenkonia lacusekhoensis]
MSIAVAVGLLTAAAVYLFMQRGMVRIVLGFILASHAANLMLFAAGNVAYREVPYIGGAALEEQADPLPQAFVLTAIVIAFAITMYMVTLAITTTTDDDTENEEESPAKVLYGERRPRPVGPPADAGVAETGDLDDVAVKGISTDSGEIAVESSEDETGERK